MYFFSSLEHHCAQGEETAWSFSAEERATPSWTRSIKALSCQQHKPYSRRTDSRNARKISLCCSSPNSLYVTAGKFTCSKCLRKGIGNSFLFPGPSLNQSFSLVPGEIKGISPSMKRTMDVHRCFPSMQTIFSFISRRLL